MRNTLQNIKYMRRDTLIYTQTASSAEAGAGDKTGRFRMRIGLMWLKPGECKGQASWEMVRRAWGC